MSGVNRLSVYYPLPLSLTPSLFYITPSLGGGGAGSGRSRVGCLWRPVGVLLLTFQTQITARLKGFIDARATWRLPHSQ